MPTVTLVCPREDEENLPPSEWTGEPIEVKRACTTTLEQRVNAFRTIVQTHSMASIDGTVVDVLSANAWVTVYDRVNPENKAKLAGMTATRGIVAAWKLIK